LVPCNIKTLKGHNHFKELWLLIIPDNNTFIRVRLEATRLCPRSVCEGAADVPPSPKYVFKLLTSKPVLYIPLCAFSALVSCQSLYAHRVKKGNSGRETHGARLAPSLARNHDRGAVIEKVLRTVWNMRSLSLHRQNDSNEEAIISVTSASNVLCGPGKAVGAAGAAGAMSNAGRSRDSMGTNDASRRGHGLTTLSSCCAAKPAIPRFFTEILKDLLPLAKVAKIFLKKTREDFCKGVRATGGVF